jgi:hypothetical protein
MTLYFYWKYLFPDPKLPTFDEINNASMKSTLLKKNEKIRDCEEIFHLINQTIRNSIYGDVRYSKYTQVDYLHVDLNSCVGYNDFIRSMNEVGIKVDYTKTGLYKSITYYPEKKKLDLRL